MEKKKTFPHSTASLFISDYLSAHLFSSLFLLRSGGFVIRAIFSFLIFIIYQLSKLSTSSSFVSFVSPPQPLLSLSLFLSLSHSPARPF